MIAAKPWDREPAENPVEVIPAKKAEGDEEPPIPTRDERPQPPRAIYIQKEDLERWGYTSNCHRCLHIRHGRKGHGIRHSEECRRRIEAELRQVGDRRVERVEDRVNQYLAEQVEQQVEQVASQEEKGGGGADEEIPDAEPMSEDDAEGAKEEMLSILEPILRRDRDIDLPHKVAKTASGIYELLILAGLNGKKAQEKIVELYSPPRVTLEGKGLGIEGITFDLQAGRDGKSWDFRRADDRARARRIIKEEKPYLVIGSPPCTDFNLRNINFNFPKMTEAERQRRRTEARVHLDFAAEIYQTQLRAGRHFLHEHPETATSWKEESIAKLLQDGRVDAVVSHQCQFNMREKDKHGEVKLVKKPTRWMSSAGELLRALHRRCDGRHLHTQLEGQRTARAAIYPPELCRAILKGMILQKERESKGIPEWVKDNWDRCSPETNVPRHEEKEHYRERALAAVREKEEPGVENEEYMQDSDPFQCQDWTCSDRSRGKEYYDAITGDLLPREETAAATEEEVKFMEQWGVWWVVDRGFAWSISGKEPLRGKWVDHNKGDSENSNVRSRWVAMEFAKYQDESLFAATPPLEAIRLLLSEAATRPRGGKREKKILLIDVRKAHLHAEAVRDVFVDLPPEVAVKGKCAHLRRCLYGTRDAASRWEALYTKKLEAMGFRRGQASACCFVHEEKEASCVVHGDDFTFLGTDATLDEIEASMRQAFLCKVEGRLGSGAGDLREARVLGRVIQWTKEGLRYEADPRHVELLVRDLGLEGATPISSPGLKLSAHATEGTEEGEEDLDPEDHRLFRACAARANYLSLDRPDITFAAKECCRHMMKPTRRAMSALKRITRYLMGKPRCVYHYDWQGGGELEVFADTDFAGCLETRKSTSGGCAFRGSHLVKHWSSTQKTIALSSGEAELAGIVKGAGESIGLRSICQDMGMNVKIRVHTDASAAIGVCRRTGIGKIRHLAVRQLWIQEKVRTGEIELAKVPGTKNPADALTKYLGKPMLEPMISRMNVRECSGRAASAPKIT